MATGGAIQSLSPSHLSRSVYRSRAGRRAWWADMVGSCWTRRIAACDASAPLSIQQYQRPRYNSISYRIECLCLSVLEYTFYNHLSKLYQISCSCSRHRYSILVWRRCDMLCDSGFVELHTMARKISRRRYKTKARLAWSDWRLTHTGDTFQFRFCPGRLALLRRLPVWRRWCPDRARRSRSSSGRGERRAGAPVSTHCSECSSTCRRLRPPDDNEGQL